MSIHREPGASSRPDQLSQTRLQIPFWRMSAETKGSQLLREIEKAKGKLKQGKSLPQSQRATTAKTLKELGVSNQRAAGAAVGNYGASPGSPPRGFNLPSR